MNATRTQIICDIWVCTDCFILHCNGDIGDPPPEYDPLSLVGEYELTAGLLAEEHHESCEIYRCNQWGGEVPDNYECNCETNPFSWQSCPGCGSPLGGERHAMSLWA